MRRVLAPKRKHFPPTPWAFREARLSVGLGIDTCADLLKVSERTVRNWESGHARIPYAAYKLMKLLRGGRVLGPEWQHYRVWRDTLITPEGHRFQAGELAWWSLIVRRARAFSEVVNSRQAEGGRQGLSQAAAAAACPPRLLNFGRAGVAGAGLVFLLNKYETLSLSFSLESVATPRSWHIFGGSGQGYLMGPTWGHGGAIVALSDWNHAGSEEDQLATARRSASHSGRSGGPDGSVNEHLHPHGDPQFHPLPGEAAAAAVGATAGDGAAGRLDRVAAGPEGGSESALPLRLRPEIQAVPRQAVGGAL